MQAQNSDTLEYWNRPDIESMYDKYLMNAEIQLILPHVKPNSKVLDAGCGEGEGTLAYSKVPGVRIYAYDFSKTRLTLARKRLADHDNVIFRQVDFLKEFGCDNGFDVVISQRFLINILDWNLQQIVILGLMAKLKDGGRLVLLEGSQQGAKFLNQFRSVLGLDPIEIRWHNLFLHDKKLVRFMSQKGFPLVVHDGLGAYFMLTRGVRPALSADLNWKCEFNRRASDLRLNQMTGVAKKLSRTKLFVFQK
jgi:ubiquinone/menaquinone biosynthesis C-methylase UbiE